MKLRGWQRLNAECAKQFGIEAPQLDKAKNPDFVFFKIRKLKRINEELEQKVFALNPDGTTRSVGFGVPTIIELVKHRFHKSDSTVVADNWGS